MVGPTRYDNNNYNVLKKEVNKESLNIIDDKVDHELNEEISIKKINDAKEKIKMATKELFSIKNDPLKKNYSFREAEIKNENDYTNNVHQAKKLVKNIPELSENIDSSLPLSLRDFFSEVKSTITIGKHDYLDVLKNIFSSYMNYVNELRDGLSSLSKHTKAGSKDGYVNVDFDSLSLEIRKIKIKNLKLFKNINIYFNKGEGDSYYRVINGEKIYYESSRRANKTIEALEKILTEISGIRVKKENAAISPNIGNTFILSLDFTEFDNFILDLYKRSWKNKDILQTEFDLFKKTLDALEKRVNTNLEELSKKYSAANSNYDNFVKIISSTMNTLMEMAKGFLRF
ncbi:IpaD/SipD/SspD family type III secretion system needle tip protein [Proteus columbae]|uniref:IpaD/SipD/SspD family type III secretion system needle tip protein n=1 Tax=Proteus columbae TaxID=1987580 RepID=UPI000C1E1DA0|nr:IpaD/SipD/SspD family type III secretion system needle tip protein [Proteus columbae]